MNNLTDQQKGSLLAFVAVIFITPDSLFIRLANIDTWGLVFYRGIIPFFTVFIGMLFIYKLNFFKIFFSSGYHGIIYVITFSITNITFVVSIQNTNVANTLVMIAMAPMLSAILGGIFLKEMPDKKTWTAIIITFVAAVFIFYDSIQLGNFFGDLFGLVTALGLAIGAVIVRSAKKKDLVPAAVAGKLIVAMFAIFLVALFCGHSRKLRADVEASSLDVLPSRIDACLFLPRAGLDRNFAEDVSGLPGIGAPIEDGGCGSRDGCSCERRGAEDADAWERGPAWERIIEQRDILGASEER